MQQSHLIGYWSILFAYLAPDSRLALPPFAAAQYWSLQSLERSNASILVTLVFNKLVIAPFPQPISSNLSDILSSKLSNILVVIKLISSSDTDLQSTVLLTCFQNSFSPNWRAYWSWSKRDEKSFKILI